jgi:hypothetical protein
MTVILKIPVFLLNPSQIALNKTSQKSERKKTFPVLVKWNNKNNNRDVRVEKMIVTGL